MKTRLYDILSDRVSVNMLKILYDQEYVAKTAHTMPFFRLRNILRKQLTLQQVLMVEAAGLITAEETDEMLIVSLNIKGKEFIEQMDRLREIIDPQPKKKEFFKVEYDLSMIEKKILVMCSKLQDEQGGPVVLENLTMELYPHGAINRKGVVTRYVNKLSGLNLLTKGQKGNSLSVELTSTGKKVIERQLMELVI
ncbi:MAG: hypothetical protein ACE5DM_02835 [Candidatus Nanoarchaeia archaeon]